METVDNLIHNKNINEKVMKQIAEDPVFRAKLCRESFWWFFVIYFADYIKYPIAEFHEELFRIAEDPSIKTAVITAFRSSAKSTILTVAYAIWSILGIQDKRFVVIVSQTQEQVRVHFKNIKRLLETNILLKQDLGPFEQDEWNSNSIVITKLNARITAVSSEQSFRGAIHGSTRPQLILCDDIEDTNSVKTREGREKVYKWFNSEIMPLGEMDTKIIVIGNLTHKDCLLMRLKEEIESGKRLGIYREYPLVNQENKILWPGKYPDMKAVEDERLRIGDKFSFSREFMLQILDDHEAVILEEDLCFYDGNLPPQSSGDFYVIGVDLAISQKDSADFTAMVVAKIVGGGKDRKIYILPNPVNERLRFPEIISRIKLLISSYGPRCDTWVYVEDVMLQGYLTHQLGTEFYLARGIKLGGLDKRARLAYAHEWIKSGRILFPENGAKDLIQQILWFGTEKHDDLCDAFTLITKETIESTYDIKPFSGLLHF